MGKIVAIGGGEMGRPKEDGNGFYPVETTSIDKEIITLTGKQHPSLLFIPTASYDSSAYYEIVRQHFLKLGCQEVNVLNLSDKSLSKPHIKNLILSHDAIYVGGGNTLRMMNTWRKSGVDATLKRAYKQGVVLSGISAGSICWFSFGSSDSRKFINASGKRTKVTGLGLIDALHCPHYDAEPSTPADLKRMLKTTRKVAIALDNCAALEVVDDTFRVISSKPTAKAWKAYWDQGEYILEEIEASHRFKELASLITPYSSAS